MNSTRPTEPAVPLARPASGPGHQPMRSCVRVFVLAFPNQKSGRSRIVHRSPPGRLWRWTFPRFIWPRTVRQVYDTCMSPRTLEAVVEGGLLRPLKDLELPEQQHVLLTIVALSDETRASVTCFDLAQKIGVIGVADDTPTDLSSNPAHFEGFGSR